MARSLFIMVSDDTDLIAKARSWGVQNNVTVNTYTSQQWSEGLNNPSFRSQVQTEAVVLSPGGQTSAKIYPFPTRENTTFSAPQGDHVQTINQMESEAITNAIIQYKGNLTEAAKALGIGRATIYRKIKQYNIDPNVGRNRGSEAA